jgi:hypothetical protein
MVMRTTKAVDQHGHRQGRTHHGDERLVHQHEGGEHRDHDQRCGGDHARTVLEAVGDGVAGGLAVHVPLAHAGHQEHLVVHGEAEDDADEHDRQEGDDRLRVIGDAQPAPLPDAHGQAEGGGDGEREAQRGDQRHPQGAEHHDQQDEGRGPRRSPRTG